MIIPGEIYKQYACGHVAPFSSAYARVTVPNEFTKSGKPVRIRACAICKSHEARMLYFFKICPECNQVVKADVGQGTLNVGWCNNCSYEASLAKLRANTPTKETLKERLAREREEAAMERLMKLVSAERYDCLFRDDCLDKHTEDEVLPCLGCSRYAPETVDVDVVMRRDYDPYENAEAFEMEAV